MIFAYLTISLLGLLATLKLLDLSSPYVTDEVDFPTAGRILAFGVAFIVSFFAFVAGGVGALVA